MVVSVESNTDDPAPEPPKRLASTSCQVFPAASGWGILSLSTFGYRHGQRSLSLETPEKSKFQEIVPRSTPSQHMQRETGDTLCAAKLLALEPAKPVLTLVTLLLCVGGPSPHSKLIGAANTISTQV